MSDYTPTSDFAFSAGSYTPTGDFEFISYQTADCVLGLSWALNVATAPDGALSQKWILIAGGVDDLAFDQSWSLAAPSFADVALRQSWSLLVPTMSNSFLRQSWGLSTVTIKDTFLRGLWGLGAPSFGYANLDSKWSLDVPAFSDVAQSGKWSLYVHDYGNGALSSKWSLTAIDGIGDVAFRQLWSLQATAVWTRVVSAVTYTLTLTGAPDDTTDIDLPMASYSSRLRSGEASYLQVSVPNAREYASEIAARPNGELIISRGTRWSDGSIDVDEIARADLSLINLDIGARSSTASLQARATQTNSSPKTVSLSGVSYRALSGGQRRFRCVIDGSLRPGDTAIIDGDSIVVGQVQHIVSPRNGYMEIAED